MKQKVSTVLVLFVLVLLVNSSVASAQDSSRDPYVDINAVLGNAISYQGYLEDNGGPVTGTCDFRFSLYDALTIGNQFGSTLTETGIQVTQGRFFIEALDFGSRAFAGQERYLKIEVRCPTNTGVFTELAPRQKITPVPFAVNTLNVTAFNPNTPHSPVENGASVSLDWTNDGINDWPRIRWGGHGEGSENGFLFQGPGNLTKLTILEDGNVGIGISPTRGRLQLQANSDQNSIYMSGGPTFLNSSLDTKWNLEPSSGNGTFSTITNNHDASGGFGLLSGNHVVSPVIWMFDNDGNNAFTVAAKGFAGTGEDISTIDSYLTPLFQVRENGFVGIGTTSPSTKLDIASGSILLDSSQYIYGNATSGNHGFFKLYDSSTGDMEMGTTFGSGDIKFTSGGSQSVIIENTGDVGIGVTNPIARLDVLGPQSQLLQSGRSLNSMTIGSTTGTLYQYMGMQAYGATPAGAGGFGFLAGTNQVSPILWMYDSPDNAVQIYKKGFNDYPNEGVKLFEFDRSGDAWVYGTTSSKVMEIRGGSDFAEPFDIVGGENIEPGMVVAIDPENPGQLRISDQAYDFKVAGCVSGANGINPGLVMSQEGSEADGEFPVALTGRVYCWADASNGPIQPGDLLTTSENPGHAMKVTNHDAAQGAIIGKAMSTLEEGTGLVLVLVTLQ